MYFESVKPFGQSNDMIIPDSHALECYTVVYVGEYVLKQYDNSFLAFVELEPYSSLMFYDCQSSMWVLFVLAPPQFPWLSSIPSSSVVISGVKCGTTGQQWI